ncbi:MAG: vitamin B12 dependent methionine synthase [Oscillospiraceae bacterium]|nr:vitamin B12 dependent methionine synthase [Oscillospiraceae bacterium]
MAELTVKQIGSHILLTLENDALTEKEREKILSMGGEDEQEELKALLEEAQAAARPKMVFQVSSIDEKGDDFVIIEGIKVVSPLMRKNFDKVNRVFPFVASCGTELEKWAEGYRDDFLAEFWCEEIRKMYLTHIHIAARPWMQETYGLTGHFASMNPGSIQDWPLSGQLQLFGMLDREKVLEEVGVKLTDSMLMLPSKSNSGIIFESGKAYENCSRCPILKCPGRRADPDPDVETR